jgi:hypothetical protein
VFGPPSRGLGLNHALLECLEFHMLILSITSFWEKKKLFSVSFWKTRLYLGWTWTCLPLYQFVVLWDLDWSSQIWDLLEFIIDKK